MIRSRTFFDGSKGFVLFSKEYKKSEPFSYREKVRIFYFNSSPPVRHSYGLGTAGPYGLRLLIFPQPLGRALKNQNAAPTTPPCFCRRQRSSSLLFKSSYPLLLLKRNCRIKQKRQLSKAVSLVVHLAHSYPNFSLLLRLPQKRPFPYLPYN